MFLLYKKDIDQIVQGCIRGERSAQRKLYELYVEKMLAVCLRYGRDHADAEDILQEGFLRVFRKIDTFKGTGSLEGWVRRVIVNTAIRHCQNRNRMVKIVYLDEFNDNLGEDVVECEFEMNELLDMIKRLPEGYRMVFNLYAIEGYAHQDIADELGISVGTSKSQLARARKHLKILILQHQQKQERQQKLSREQSAG